MSLPIILKSDIVKSVAVSFQAQISINFAITVEENERLKSEMVRLEQLEP